jgi:DNA-binding NtrC family response regulator
MGSPPQILLVDDDPALAQLAGGWLEGAGMSVHAVASGEAALAALEGFVPSAILLDMKLPGIPGLDVLRAAVARTRHVPVVVLTAHREAELAVECMKAGAYDYLVKPIDAPKLVATLANALRHRQLSFTVEALRREAAGAGLGEQLDQSVDRAAGADVAVLLRGPRGPRRELVARALHQRSSRAGGPFVVGEVGAGGRAFSAAAWGTLFVEDPETLAPGVQTSLAEAATAASRSRQGQGSAPDFRLIAATEVDLGGRARMGTFRADLYLRLSVVELTVDPERGPDRPGASGDPLSLAERERRAILEALDQTQGNRAAAARELGIGRATLYRRLKEHDIE